MSDLVRHLRDEAKQFRDRSVLPSEPMWDGLHLALVAIAARYNEAADALEWREENAPFNFKLKNAEQRIKELEAEAEWAKRGWNGSADRAEKAERERDDYRAEMLVAVSERARLSERLAAVEAERDALLRVARAARAWDKHRRTFGYNTFCDEERALANAVAALDALPERQKGV